MAMWKESPMEGSKRRRNAADKRTLILDTAEQIMREEGYAAVSARRVAEKAGLKSMPVHYHFGSMDELLLALYRRSEEKYLARLAAALASPTPLKDYWALEHEPMDVGLLSEYLALANHRPAIRAEVARSDERIRVLKTAIIRLNLDLATMRLAAPSPEILAFIIDAVGRMLVAEKGLGISSVHEEVERFFHDALTQLEPASRAAPASGRRPRTALGKQA